MSAALLAVVAIVLVGSAIGHLSQRGGLRSAIDQHRVLPARLAPAVAAGLPFAELALGAALLCLLVAGSDLTRWAALVTGAFLVLMTGYAHLASRRAGGDERGSAGLGVPCGCGLGDTPLGLWVTVRSGLLATLALVGGLTLGSAGLLSRDLSELVVMAAAMVSLSIGIALLPQARQSFAGVAR